MGRYKNGDHVKVEVGGASPSDLPEWIWMLVDSSDDDRQLVFGRLDNQSIAGLGLKRGQELVVRYDKVVDHRRFEKSIGEG